MYRNTDLQSEHRKVSYVSLNSTETIRLVAVIGCYTEHPEERSCLLFLQFDEIN